MYFVYIIKSQRRKWFYVGITNNLRRRLNQHNLGKTKSTKSNTPYKLIYKRKFDNREKARDFEKFLKIRSNKETLLGQLGYL